MPGESPSTASAKPADPTKVGRRVPLAKLALYSAFAAVLSAVIWYGYGRKIWSDYQDLRREVIASENSAPVGYIGLNYRRSYNDRPLAFGAEKGGRKLLFAAKGPDGHPEYYDVTDSNLEPKLLEGGYGRDSIPGVDSPIIDAAGSSRVRAIRARQEVFGAELSEGPRAYPKDLVEKIEVVNDVDSSVPFVLVYDRARGKAFLFERTLGGAVITFGTTGYSLEKRPLLYDRKTRSLWLPEGDDLVCVCGASKGTRAKAYRPVEPIPWSGWVARHPKTSVLMGNDRKKEIPPE